MSHDHEAVDLAVAALDFELTPDERHRMAAGLSECPECAQIAASHGDLARLLDMLPVHDASPHVRQRVMRAALVPPRQRPWTLLLVAAALLGLSAAAAAAAVGAFREPLSLDAVVPVPSASLPALGDLASPVPASSEAPSSTDVAPGVDTGFVPGAPLVADTLAEVVSDRVRIRSEPRIAEDSIKYEPLLDVGDQLLILDGPVIANDYEWYLISAFGFGDEFESWPVGWVARGDHDGTPWIRARADSCPTGTITMATVLAMWPQERVACLGDRPLRLRGLVSGTLEPDPCTPEPETACVDGPTWLTGEGGGGMRADVTADTGGQETPGPRLALDPDGPVPSSAIPSYGMVDLEGAFDHPAAQDCRPGAVGPGARPIPAAAARSSCRSRFVVTRVVADPDYPIQYAAAITVSDDLRVRSAPGLDSERHELLARGTPVWVVDGPVVGNDYEWFQVIVPSVDTGDGAPRVGWVAASDRGADRWLAKRTLDCPDPGSLAVADLERLMTTGAGDSALGCLGSTTIQFRGTVQLLCGREGRPGWEMTPAWLSANALYQLSIRTGASAVIARPGPGLDVPLGCDALDDAEWSIEAHFDDPAADECEAIPPTSSEPLDTYLLANFWCRTTLVIDRLTPMSTVRPTARPS